MACLPKDIRPYFEALTYGLADLLPVSRVANQRFLLRLHNALEREPRLTAFDLVHLRTLMGLADQVVFPPIDDVKSCCEVEAFLVLVCPCYPKKQIRLALRWALLLLARHGSIQVDLPNVAHWFRIWQKVQAFHPVEQGFMVDFVRWMLNKSFSSRSMTDIMREVHRFRQWMNMHGLVSLGQVENLELQRYLLDRACNQSNAAKQKILGSLRTLFYYYQEAIDGGYRVPDYVVKAPRPLGVNASASSEEIEQLWELLEARQDASSDLTLLSPVQGLMLILVIGYGLPLKILPLLELGWEPGALTYTDRLPCRRGENERFIRLDLSIPWIALYWQAYMAEREAENYPYLFTSGHGQRRKRPVSMEYCQRVIQEAVHRVLEYPIPVNHLERGALKRLARLNALTHFMMLTADCSKSRLARMMYWLTCRHD